MRARRRPAVVASLVLVAVLTGCASEQERYCDALADRADTLEALSERAGEDDVLDDAVQVFTELRDEAPGDIADEWSTVLFAYEALADAFDAAGATPRDLAEGAGKDLSPEERSRIEGAAAELRTPRVMAAADGIEQHARDVCKVDLGLGG